ncbi:hypothetical protein [Spirosoma harenae]
MDRSNPTKGWQLHVIRGLLYLLIGVNAFIGMTTFAGQSVPGAQFANKISS